MNITNDEEVEYLKANRPEALKARETAFFYAATELSNGHDIQCKLPSGKIRTLRQINPGESDCNFLKDQPLIVTINENCNDQCEGIWTTMQEDFFRDNWVVLPRKKKLK